MPLYKEGEEDSQIDLRIGSKILEGGTGPNYEGLKQNEKTNKNICTALTLYGQQTALSWGKNKYFSNAKEHGEILAKMESVNPGTNREIPSLAEVHAFTPP